jgi:hypothetical protein
MKSQEDISDTNKEKVESANHMQDGEGKHKSSKEGVHLSEEFQQRVHELTHNATDHECGHLHRCISDREDALRKEKASKSKKATGASTPAVFSDAEMPQD